MSDQLRTPTVGLNLQQSIGPRVLSTPDVSGFVAEAGRNARVDLRPQLDALYRVERRKQLDLAEAQVQEEILSATQQTEAILREYRTLEQKDAVDKLPEYQKRLSKVLNTTSQRATGYVPIVRQTVETKMRSLAVEADAEAKQWELEQQIEWRDTTLQGLKSEALNKALRYKDNPTLYAKYLDEFKGYIAQQLDNEGIPQGTDAWNMRMRQEESNLHAINIYDDIARDKFGLARQKLDGMREFMNQEKWLELDRMLIASQKAYADAHAGRNALNTDLKSYRDSRYTEFVTNKKNLEIAKELIRTTRNVIEKLKDKDGNIYKDSNGQEVISYRPLTEQELNEQATALVNRWATDYAYASTEAYRLEVEGNVNYMKGLEQNINSNVITYVNQEKQNGRSVSIAGFKQIMGEQAYFQILGKFNGDQASADEFLQNKLTAYYNNNHFSRPETIFKFENWFDAASNEQILRMDRVTFDQQFGQYMNMTDAENKWNEVVNRQQGINKTFSQENRGLVKETILEQLPDSVIFNIPDNSGGDPETNRKAELGRYTYNLVFNELQKDPRVASGEVNLRLAVNNILKRPDVMMKIINHDIQNEDVINDMQTFFATAGIDTPVDFASWALQAYGTQWKDLTFSEKYAVVNSYNRFFQTSYTPEFFDRMLYQVSPQDQARSYISPSYGFDPVRGYPTIPGQILEGY